MLKIRQHSGSILPAVLAILAILSTLALNAIQSATIESHLTGSLSSAQNAFNLAAYGLERGLQLAESAPADLPAALEGAAIDLAESNFPKLGHNETRIVFIGSDTYCPNLEALPHERLLYEIQSTGISGTASNTQHQGFSICSEVCGTHPCVGTESSATANYWTVTGDQ